MTKYKFRAEVTREIIDSVVLDVEAESELHAYAIAENVLESFPEGNTSIDFLYIEARQYLGPTKMELNTRE